MLTIFPHAPLHYPLLFVFAFVCVCVCVVCVCVCVLCIYMIKTIFVFWRPTNQNTTAVIDIEYVFPNKTLLRSQGLISTFPVNLSITDNVGTNCSAAVHN